MNRSRNGKVPKHSGSSSKRSAALWIGGLLIFGIVVVYAILHWNDDSSSQEKSGAVTKGAVLHKNNKTEKVENGTVSACLEESSNRTEKALGWSSKVKTFFKYSIPTALGLLSTALGLGALYSYFYPEKAKSILGMDQTSGLSILAGGIGAYVKRDAIKKWSPIQKLAKLCGYEIESDKQNQQSPGTATKPPDKPKPTVPPAGSATPRGDGLQSTAKPNQQPKGDTHSNSNSESDSESVSGPAHDSSGSSSSDPSADRLERIRKRKRNTCPSSCELDTVKSILDEVVKHFDHSKVLEAERFGTASDSSEEETDVQYLQRMTDGKHPILLEKELHRRVTEVLHMLPPPSFNKPTAPKLIPTDTPPTENVLEVSDLESPDWAVLAYISKMARLLGPPLKPEFVLYETLRNLRWHHEDYFKREKDTQLVQILEKHFNRSGLGAAKILEFTDFVAKDWKYKSSGNWKQTKGEIPPRIDMMTGAELSDS